MAFSAVFGGFEASTANNFSICSKDLARPVNVIEPGFNYMSRNPIEPVS
jgi:hypothetical protein